MSVENEVRALNDKRMNTIHQAREFLVRASSEGRAPTVEELESHSRAMAEVDRIDKAREGLIATDRAQEEIETVNEAYRSVATPSERADANAREQREADAIMDFFRPEFRTKGLNAIEIDLTTPARAFDNLRNGVPISELRAPTLIGTDTGDTVTGGSLTVPTTVATSIYAYMTASVAMRRIGATILTTSSGNAMTFPKVGTHGIGTQVATQNTAFAGTNPILSTMTLNAYDFGQLIPVSSDMLEDSGVDVLSFVTRQIGRAIGQVTATAYVTGSGSSAPNGVQTAIGGAGTIATGGSLILGTAGQELEKLIDVQYSVVDSYRQNGAAWLMRDLTGARIRKIRDGAGGTAGQFVWQPSPTVGAIGGQPDTFLGDPVYFDPNVASMASDAKIVFYGDWSAYYIRDTRNFRLERSDDLYFDKNQVAFRGLLRTDGDVIDTAALNCLHQAVT